MTMQLTKQLLTGAITVAAILVSGGARAEWGGKGELGLVLARGNTESETVSAKADLTGKFEKWQHLVGFSVLQTRSAGVQTGDRYELHGQSDYAITERAYALGSARYDNDQFSPYSYQVVGAVGVGYRFFNADEIHLSVEVGAGYRKSKDRLLRTTDSETIARGALNYDQKLTETTSVYDKLLVESGSSNTYIQNEAGVKVAINSSLALSVGYAVRYNTDVIAPAKHTDELITAALVFSY